MCVVINPERDRLSLWLCINFVMFLVYFQNDNHDIITLALVFREVCSYSG